IEIALAKRSERRQRPVQDEHPYLGAGVARGECLAVGPDAVYRIAGAREVLREDEDLHARGMMIGAATARLIPGISWPACGDRCSSPFRLSTTARGATWSAA